MEPKGKPQTIASYIAAAPKESRAKIRQMRTAIRSVAPGATESLKWGMPSFSYKRILVIYGAFKKHIGFYPTPSPLVKFSKELSKFKSSRGSVQFPYDKPLPVALIRKITRFRVKESKEEDKKWKEQ